MFGPQKGWHNEGFWVFFLAGKYLFLSPMLSLVFFFLSLHHSFVDVPLVTTIFLSSHNSVQILPMAEYSEWSRASETL